MVLDINLPGRSGLEVLKSLRSRGDGVPVILLTARSETRDRVAGLDMGADDYLVKPFEMDELEARIRALSRRKNLDYGARETIGRLEFDRTTRRAIADGEALEIPRRELAVLECLLERRGRIVSKSQLADHVYGIGADVDDTAIEPHVSRLRRRLVDHGNHDQGRPWPGLHARDQELMARARSLRTRLFVLILGPLVLMAILLGFWRYTVAQDTAEKLFDRSLLSAALAISRDVAVSGGDALSPSTRDLIRDAAGGEVFYHATGPSGIYVTGYAYPPATGRLEGGDPHAPAYLEAVYRGEPVRVLRVTERVTIEDLIGDATVTVWQRLGDRDAFATALALRAAGLMGGLLVTLVLVVWFGVRYGLRSLTDLQDAIAARSPDDLSTIKRPVPTEIGGIVGTLNRLFLQLQKSIDAQQVFISDAAHQLKNPAAAVQTMADSVRDAASEEERNRRITELIEAARASSRVADQLLSLDRLQQTPAADRAEDFDLHTLTEEICTSAGAPILSQGLDFELIARERVLPVHADRLFVSEAIKNLIDNAQKHGGAELRSISVETGRDGAFATVTVRDDGSGLSPTDEQRAFSRFGQIEPTSGSGLGLAIASSVAERHGGMLRIDQIPKGASLTLSLPLEN